MIASLAVALSMLVWAAPPHSVQDFQTVVRPVLQENCGSCHNPANPRNRNDFLKAQTARDMEQKRTLWRSVATQLRNRTMPPTTAAKITEDQRLQIATWVETQLRTTACAAGDYAGAVAPRRLNRREYHNTIRDLLGVDFAVTEAFPADESAGAGFDTNGETLFIPPMLMERYMEAAQKILDRAIVTPPMNKVFSAPEMEPHVAPSTGPKPGRRLEPGQELSAEFPVFLDGQYSLRVSVERPAEIPFEMEVKVDGVAGGRLAYGRDRNGGPTARAHVANLDRGVHKVTIVAGKEPVWFYSFTVEQRPAEASPDRKALHYRLFGLDPGEYPVDPRAATRRLLAKFLPKAYRRPVEPAEVDRFLTLYDRAAERGDPYEERIKLALKAVLISPRFLFKVEDHATKPGIFPLSQYDIASRLSYFLWATMPDAELLSLAEQGRLRDSQVLMAQVDRMLDDPRSRAFAAAFIGQWLGTQEIGGRAVPLLTELQHYYTPEVAADLRQEPVLFFQHIVAQNRSLLELINGNYTFMTERLSKFYKVDGQIKGLSGDTFTRVEWPDNRRAGVLGFASVLAMTSHYRQASPVLRGAWVLDTMLGTPVPSPPPDVPPLEQAAKSDKGLTMRQILERHRSNASCATCHNLMDPIGLGLENFDWMGRWRDKEANGSPVDASGALPSGEKFNGAMELRQVLLERKDDFLHHLAGKMMGFALGRGLQDGDQCTVQHLVESLQKENYSARTLIRGIVLSSAFRNTQGGIETPAGATPITKRAPRRLLGEK